MIPCVNGSRVRRTVEGEDWMLWMLVVSGAVVSMRVEILPARIVRSFLSGWFVMYVDQFGVNMVDFCGLVCCCLS